MEARRWKAFVRLSGESLVDRDEEILTEFKGFAQSLKRTGIEYSIFLKVEDYPKSSAGSHDQLRSTVHDSSNGVVGD